MNILFLGDYSNLHTTLAKTLRDSGHIVHVVSDRCGHMNLDCDYFLSRTPGLAGAFKYIYDIFSLLPSLKDYDVVQLINSNFLKLRPGKIKYFFDRLKEQNKSVFLTLAGDDYYYCKACYDGKLFRFSEFKTGGEFTRFHKENPNRLFGWMNHANKKWAEYLYDKIDGAMSVLPEYDIAAKPVLGEKLSFTNLPIRLEDLPSPDFKVGSPVRITVGMRSGSEIQKGTQKLLKIAKELETKYPGKILVDNFKDLAFTDYIKRLQASDIVLDQLYAYSPAMNALYAMALGKVAASGGEEEYYAYLGNPVSKPVFKLSPFVENISGKLLDLIENPEEIVRRGKEGRKLVETYNDSKVVASRFLKHWESVLK